VDEVIKVRNRLARTDVLQWFVCHEHRRPHRDAELVREMKEGPSGSGNQEPIPSHRKVPRSVAFVSGWRFDAKRRLAEAIYVPAGAHGLPSPLQILGAVLEFGGIHLRQRIEGQFLRWRNPNVPLASAA
jgi:hypothetical protein